MSIRFPAGTPVFKPNGLRDLPTAFETSLTGLLGLEDMADVSFQTPGSIFGPF